jgi:hypothetical protein
MNQLAMMFERLPVRLEAEDLVISAHFIPKDELWSSRSLRRCFLQDCVCSITVVEYNEGLAEDGNMADGTVQVFELDPVLVFWDCSIWHVSDVAEDGEGLGTRREILARLGSKV